VVAPVPIDEVAVIVGAHPFPHGNASANRMLTMAMTWHATGFRVLLVNDDPRLAEGNAQDWIEYRGIDYLNLGHPSTDLVQRARRRQTQIARSAAAVSERVDPAKVAYLVVGSMMATPSTERRAGRHFPHAQLVADVVERHDRSQFPRLGLHPYYLRHLYTNWHLRRSPAWPIVITRSLAAGPLAKRRPLVLPPCVDTEEVKPPSGRPREPVQISYIGSPGTKDDLARLAEAVADLPSELRRSVRVTLAGVTDAEWRSMPGMSEALAREAGETMTAVGRIDRAGVLRLLDSSHFTFLLRDPEAGFARYGFPSKVPESLAAGCPVITNLTSDLGSYLLDRDNAILCSEFTTGSVSSALMSALEATRSGEFERMSSAARATAVNQFSPSSWAAELAQWLDRPHRQDPTRPRGA
jgi:glycosyltransferase involved in cell wall biosynthesis